jgi:hypothetical protein
MALLPAPASWGALGGVLAYLALAVGAAVILG